MFVPYACTQLWNSLYWIKFISLFDRNLCLICFSKSSFHQVHIRYKAEQISSSVNLSLKNDCFDDTSLAEKKFLSIRVQYLLLNESKNFNNSLKYLPEILNSSI